MMIQKRRRDVAWSTRDRMPVAAGRVQEEWTAGNGCTPMLPSNIHPSAAEHSSLLAWVHGHVSCSQLTSA